MGARSNDHVIANDADRAVQPKRTAENEAMKSAAMPLASPSNVRWIWGAFFLLIVLPLYAIAVTVCIRSGLFRFNGGNLSNDQLKAVWTFLAAGLAATATVLGSILTMSHNNKTLAFQAESSKRQELLEAETNERLNLDTVIHCLGVICHDDVYSPKAATAAGLATLVHLGHPMIAMRALNAAFPDNAVDRNTAAWLIGAVLLTDKTKGTPADLIAAKEEASGLLLAYVPKFSEPTIKGDYAWPDAVTARWPPGLSRIACQNVIQALGDLLLSRDNEWWRKEGATFTWIVYTLDEAVQSEININAKKHAAAVAAAIMEVTTEDHIAGHENWRPKTEVAKRMASVLDGKSPDAWLPDFCARIRAWGQDQSRLSTQADPSIPAHNSQPMPPMPGPNTPPP